MSKPEIEEIAASVIRLAQPGATPKALMEAVRKEHPNASKKDVIRAAFYAVLSHADEDTDRARLIHNFATVERSPQNTPD